MSYVEKNCLVPNEKITLRVQKSKVFLFWAWFWGVLGCWLLLVPIILAIRETIIFNTTEYIITDKKVIEKYGWISVKYDQMGIEKVENVTSRISFWGRLFNFGDVIIQGTNGNDVIFSRVRNTNQIVVEINKLLFDNKTNDLSPKQETA